MKRLLSVFTAALAGLTVTSCQSLKKDSGGGEYPQYGSYSDGGYNPYPRQAGYSGASSSSPATPQYPQYQQYTAPQQQPAYSPEPEPEPEPSYTPPKSSRPKSSTTKKKSSSSSSRGGSAYTVRSGDTLYRIAIRNHVTVSALKRANHLSSDVIHPGQHLTIP